MKLSLSIYLKAYSPAMISRSLGSKLTVHGKNVLTSRATRTGVREDKNTSKFLISPSISSRGSTSLVVGIFFEILVEKIQISNKQTTLESDFHSEMLQKKTVQYSCICYPVCWKMKRIHKNLHCLQKEEFNIFYYEKKKNQIFKQSDLTARFREISEKPYRRLKSDHEFIDQ